MLHLLKRVRVWHFIAALMTMFGVGFGAGEYDIHADTETICESWCETVTARKYATTDGRSSFVSAEKCYCSWYSDSGFREYELSTLMKGRE